MKFIITVLFSIISIFKWIWKTIICCGKRQKESNLLPFTLDSNINPVKYSVPNNDVELESWDNWDNERSNEQVPETSTENAEIDFFTDMTPKFVKTKKVLVKPGNQMTGNHNMFTVKSNIQMASTGSELGVWDDSTGLGASSWGDEATEDITEQCNDAIKEKRDKERKARKQHRQNKEISVR